MRKFLLFGFLFFMVSTVFAQGGRITGKVTAKDDGSGLPGVTVQVKNTTQATSTDADGNYSLTVSSLSGTLVFRSVGFENQEVAISNRSIINVTLGSDENFLSEVVVTGYGNFAKNKFAGAATILKASDVVENTAVGSFTHTLQGRAPGVLVNSGSGQPGSNATIRIRGEQSIAGAGAQPLYVLDGVPIDAGTFYAMNPNDFETMTILKDANAAAMYGARGGVGVVVITTKQGKAGKTQYTARFQSGITSPPDFSRLNLMSSSELLAYEERIGLMGGNASSVPGWLYSRKNPANANKTEAELAAFDAELQKRRDINTDIADLLFRTGKSNMYEVAASGGTEKVRFYASGNFFDQQGIDLTSGLKRYTGRYNLTNTGKKVSFTWNNLLAYSERKNAVGDLLGNSAANPFQMIYRGKPYDNPYLPDGTLNSGAGGTNLNLKSLANVLERNNSSSDRHNQMKLNSGLTVTYDITDELTFRNVFGIDASNTLRESYINPGTYSGSLVTIGQNGLAREASYIGAELINTSSLTYTKTLNEDHSFKVGGFFEGIRGYNKGSGFLLYNLNPALLHTGQGATALPTNGALTMPQNASSARSGYGIRSYFATGEYSFSDRISLNANIRRDGTSRIMNEANNEVTTWSVGGVWNITNESFMSNISAVSNARLRASYGTVPNIGSIALGAYNMSAGIGAGAASFAIPNYAGTQLPGFTSTTYLGSTIPGLAPSSPGNSNYKIERIQKLNIGLDLGLFKDRLSIALDVYQNKTIDLFVSQPLSSTTGFNTLDINAGQMSNKGFELAINGDIFKTKDLRISAGFNHAMNINNIDDLGLVEEYFLGTFVIRKGLPYGTHYTYNYLGADPATGKPTYETAPDENGNTTSTTDFSQAGQFAKFGTFQPKHMGGFNLDVSYKGFFVSSLFSYQFDVVRSNNTRNWITDGTIGYASAVNQSRELIDNQWLQPGDQKFFPSPLYAKNFTSSDLEDARFLRFRELKVGYALPSSIVGENKFIKGVSVYANFFNLAIWSPWRGVDPEDNNNISLVEYPNPRMAVFGIDLKL